MSQAELEAKGVKLIPLADDPEKHVAKHFVPGANAGSWFEITKGSGANLKSFAASLDELATNQYAQGLKEGTVVLDPSKRNHLRLELRDQALPDGIVARDPMVVANSHQELKASGAFETMRTMGVTDFKDGWGPILLGYEANYIPSTVEQIDTSNKFSVVALPMREPTGQMTNQVQVRAVMGGMYLEPMRDFYDAKKDAQLQEEWSKIGFRATEKNLQQSKDDTLGAVAKLNALSTDDRLIAMRFWLTTHEERDNISAIKKGTKDETLQAQREEFLEMLRPRTAQMGAMIGEFEKKAALTQQKLEELRARPNPRSATPNELHEGEDRGQATGTGKQ